MTTRPIDRACMIFSAVSFELRHLLLCQPPAMRQQLRATYPGKQKPVGPPVCHRQFGETGAQFLLGDVADDRHQGPFGVKRRRLGDRRKVALIPCVAKHAREDVAASFHHGKDAGELGLQNHRPLVGYHLVVLGGVGDQLDQALARGNARRDAIAPPFGVGDFEDLAHPPGGSSFFALLVSPTINVKRLVPCTEPSTR